MFPVNETVILLDADLLAITGDNETAVIRCDEALKLSDESDSIPYVIKANILMQKVFFSFDS